MLLTMKLPTLPFYAWALELPGLASVFANQNCFVEEKQQKKKFQESFC